MERVRTRVGVSLTTLLLLLVVGIPAVAQSARPIVFELSTLDKFDDPTAQRWAVYGSKFTSEGYPQVAYVNAFPESLYGRYFEGADELLALGIHAKWDRKGYNYVEIVPVIEGEDGALEPKPMEIRGKASRIDVWMWGGNFNYYAEAHLLDYNGVPHRIFLGDLNFVGWKNLSLVIPVSIPQLARWIPQERPLSLTKIVIWTRPSERVDDFYVYIDELKVLTDVAELRFDGDRLAQRGFLEEAWKDAKTQGE